MSYEEFWHGKPILAVFYRKKHLLDIEQRNQELWMQGLYFLDAISVALNNSFSKHKAKYIAEPIRITPKTEEEARRDLIEEAADVYNALGFLLGVDEHIQAYNIIQKKKDRWLGRIEEAKVMAEVIKETKEEFGGWDE